MFDRLSGLAAELAQLFTQSGQRSYWPWLLSALLIAGLVHLRARTRAGAHEGSAFDLRAAFARWTGASSRVDMALTVAKPIIFTLAATPWALSAVALAGAVASGLGQHASPPAQAWLSSTQVTLLYTLVLFVAWDFSRFALHLAMHRVEALWQLHQVHHSADVLTPLTLHRVHPIESALYRVRGVVVTGLVTGVFFSLFGARAQAWELLGVNALGLAFNAVGGNLRHSHVHWSWGARVEAWLISPAQHQLHHSAETGPAAGSATNYGTWLALWDRALGSLRAAGTTPVTRFGLPDEELNHDAHSWVSALFDPLAGMFGVFATKSNRAWGGRTGRASAPTRAAGLGAALVALLAPHKGHAQSPPASDGNGYGEFPPVDLQPGPERSQPSQVPEATPPPAESDAPDLDLSAAPDPQDEGADLDLSDEGEDGPDLDLSDDEDEGDEGDEGDETLDTAVPPVDDTPSQPEADLGDYDILTDTVSIIGQAQKTPRVVGSAHRLDSKTLERLELDDVHSLLQLVPGVYVRGEDGFGLRPNIGLRGVDANRSSKITLMEDGVLLGPAPYAAPAAYFFPLTTRMVGLEVFKGPAAIRHGPNTIGGAVNLQTRPVPNKPTGGIDLGGGLRGYAKAHGFWGRSWRHGGLLIEGARIQSNGFKRIDGGGNTGFGKNEFMVKGRAHSNPANPIYHQVDVKLGASTERSNETYLGLSAQDFAADPYRRYAASQKGRMSWWRSQAEVSYLLAKDEVIEFRATAYRHDFSRAWRKFNSFRGGPNISDVLGDESGGQAAIFLAILRGEEDSSDPDQSLLIGTNDRRYVSQGLQTVLHWRPQWAKDPSVFRQDIEFGARLHHDQIQRVHDEEAFVMLRGTLVPEGSELQVTTRNRGRALAGALHLVDEISIIDAITLTPGARVELIETRFDDQLAGSASRAFNPVFVPGMGAHVQVIDQLGIFAGVHSGFSPVAPGQPNEVKPERSINYELGTRAKHRGFQAELTGFFSDYKNLTGECTFAQGCDDTNIGAQFNAGKVRVAGAEASAEYTRRISGGSRRPAGWVSVASNYTFTWSRFETSFSSASPQFGEVAAGDALPYLPMHTASAQLSGGTKRFSLNASVRVSGEMRDVPGQGEIPDAEAIPAYATLDLGGRVWVSPRASLYTTLTNVTNASYAVSQRPFGLRPGRPFFGMVGFKYDFR